MTWTYTINPVSVPPPVPELDPVEGVLFTIRDDDEIVCSGMARSADYVALMAAAYELAGLLFRSSLTFRRLGLARGLVDEITAVLDRIHGVEP